MTEQLAMFSSAGERGGPVPPHTKESGIEAIRRNREEETAWVMRFILNRCRTVGSFHGDDLENVYLSERNIIGAAVNALQKERKIVSTGEHRSSKSPASHGRKSYVWRLR